jgi:transcription termination factor NusB
MQLFGFEILRKKDDKPLDSIVSPSPSDGSTVVNTGVNAGGYYGMVMDLDGIIKNENDLIRRYREVATYSDCDGAIEDIVGEAIVYDEEDQTVTINLDDTELSDTIKEKIRVEFNKILKLLKFGERGHDIFRSWYVDGRLYYHILLDEKNLKAGIQELRYIDPRKIRKIKNVIKSRTPQGVEVVKEVQEYYLYNDKGITEQTTQGVKLSLDSVVYVPSGYMDANTGMMMSYLHKAIKPTNQLKMIEDSLVIYRISRAPERRIFYVDVGNLPKIKAEQYVNDIMNKFRNKIVYDATTGEVRDDRRHLSMMEDFWMPRREGGKGTEITTLPGGQNLGEIQDIEYFQQKLYRSLNVPIGRLQEQQGFSIGRAQEISRDEVKFHKFIVRLRNKFATIFTEALRVQLVAANIMRPEEWDEIKQDIRYNFVQDNHYAELMNAEVLNNRIALLQQIEPYLGRFYSMDWVRRNVLQLTEDEIEEMQEQMDGEEEYHMSNAERTGEMAAATQAAQQNFLQANAPQALEAPVADAPQPNNQ